MKRGQWHEAAGVLEALLREDDHDAGALRLLGTVHYAQGNLSTAAEMLRMSLALAPANAEAHLNLGSVYLAGGKHAQALDEYQTVLSIDSGSVDAHFNLGVTFESMGNTAEAQVEYRKSLELDPGLIDARINLAASYLRQRAPHACVRETTELLRLDPSNVHAHLLCAGAYQDLTLMDPAAEHLDAAEHIVPSDPRVVLARGRWLLTAGRAHEAAEVLRAAADASPGAEEAWVALASAHLELGQTQQAADILERAAEKLPHAAAIRRQLGTTLQSLGRIDDALTAVDRAVELNPNSWEAQAARGRVLVQADRNAEADSAFQCAVNLAPSMAQPHLARAELRMQRGEHHAALRICNEYLAGNPAERSMLALKGALLNESGNAAAARELVDADRLVMLRHIAPPPEYENLSAFNRALCEHVREHPSLASSPSSHATRCGQHTGNLLVAPRGPFVAFEQLLWEALERYRASHSHDPAHPFLEHNRRLDNLVCWAVVMRRAGHQVPHIHPAAWLSGVYYAAVPQAVTDDDSHEGWIAFGQAPEHLALSRKPRVNHFKPEAGMMLLFPSYFYHHTVPFSADEERISIAFDFLPAREDMGI